MRFALVEAGVYRDPHRAIHDVGLHIGEVVVDAKRHAELVAPDVDARVSRRTARPIADDGVQCDLNSHKPRCGIGGWS
jgi:hypothetical protein